MLKDFWHPNKVIHSFIHSFKPLSKLYKLRAYERDFTVFQKEWNCSCFITFWLEFKFQEKANLCTWIFEINVWAATKCLSVGYISVQFSLFTVSLCLVYNLYIEQIEGCFITCQLYLFGTKSFVQKYILKPDKYYRSDSFRLRVFVLESSFGEWKSDTKSVLLGSTVQCNTSPCTALACTGVEVKNRVLLTETELISVCAFDHIHMLICA